MANTGFRISLSASTICAVMDKRQDHCQTELKHDEPKAARIFVILASM